MSETTEKEKETGLKSLIDRLDKQQKVAFCSYLGLHGASFYTMRDKLVYGTGWFALWELKGVEGMIREFDPDYEGEAEDFIARDGEKTAFATYMAETGGMSKTTCYQRFKIFNFKKWEVVGLERMFRLFMDFHKEGAA